jgi:hypothetical protein
LNVPSYRFTLSSGQSFIAPGDSCATVRQSIADQFRASLATCGGGDSSVLLGTELRYMDQTTGAVIATPYAVLLKEDVPTPPMQWGSVPHLLQASLVVACVFALVMGIKAGDRL